MNQVLSPSMHDMLSDVMILIVILLLQKTPESDFSGLGDPWVIYLRFPKNQKKFQGVHANQVEEER